MVAGTTGESPTLSDDEKLALLEAVLDEVGDQATVICGTGSNDTRHSVELTGAAAEAGADGGARRHALLQQAEPRRPAGPLRGGRRGGRRDADDPLQHPLAMRDQRPAGLSPSCAEIDNVVGVKQANNDELGPIEGLDVLAGNDDVFLRMPGVGGAGGILVASHLVGAADARDLRRGARPASSTGPARSTPSLRPLYEALAVTTNPMPVKAALEMLG